MFQVVRMASGIPCHKIILCGEYGVGKSSIFRRFVDNSFTDDNGPRSTIGLDHFSKSFNLQGRQIKVSKLSVNLFHFYITNTNL